MTTPDPDKHTKTPEQVRADLEARRALEAARKADRLERLREKTQRGTETRAIRQAAARDRMATSLGRAKMASDIAQSAEARALRVQRTGALTLWALLPVFAAFAAWSTAGVHAGAAAMTGADPGSAMWWALWCLEPALLGTVAWILIVRARLSASGGQLSDDALRIMWGYIGASIVLNAIGHWPDGFSLQAIGALAAHSLGPIGAAMTAHLIGVVLTAVATAKPHKGEGVRSLAELVPEENRTTFESTSKGSSGAGRRDPQRSPERAWEVPDGATRLPLVTRPATTSGASSQKGQRSTRDQGEQSVSEVPRQAGEKTPRKPRADKGVKYPPRTQKTPRTLTDEELLGQLEVAIADSGLATEPSITAVQKALGVGFDRARRVLSLREVRAAESAPVGLSVVAEETAHDTEEGVA